MYDRVAQINHNVRVLFEFCLGVYNIGFILPNEDGFTLVWVKLNFPLAEVVSYGFNVIVHLINELLDISFGLKEENVIRKKYGMVFIFPI